MNSKAWQALVVGGWLVLAGGAWGADMSDHAVGRNVADAKFAPFPGLPPCGPGSVLSGDPAKGPSIILAKAATGCTVPWHWHTANEHLMIVKGAVRLDMRNGKPITIREGGYAMLPAKHLHQFVCTKSCLFYVHSDAALDIHYVDQQGKEIPVEQALKAVNKKGAGSR